MRSLADCLTGDPYAGYAYAYPHKTSYAPLEPAVRLRDAWRSEAKDALFLYVHLPFCEMRCGFCNLFTTVQPDASLVERTLEAIKRQSEVVALEVQAERISQVAFGGGTPSFLSVQEIEQLFHQLASFWPVDWSSANCSFEVSPATICEQKLALLRTLGVDRISIGVQSFSADDLQRLGRPQSSQQVERAISAIQNAGFPTFNLDLIYGVQGQTQSSWLETIRRAIAIGPDEMYLYPLYVRELTGLGRHGQSPSEWRRQLYLAARDALESAGYEQQSMRFFRRPGGASATDYCCQDDGMIGLGPGARSYTRELHYSSEFAVGKAGVQRIIGDFNAREPDRLAYADYGVKLDGMEQRRRFIIKSLLRAQGLDLAAYHARFGGTCDDDFPQLAELSELGLGVREAGRLRLNSEGLSWSDVIGPWLYSNEVASRMEAFELA